MLKKSALSHMQAYMKHGYELNHCHTAEPAVVTLPAYLPQVEPAMVALIDLNLPNLVSVVSEVPTAEELVLQINFAVTDVLRSPDPLILVPIPFSLGSG